MEKSVLMGGFGGQGVQTCGKLLIYTANEEGQIATFFSQYGGAVRGGTSNCMVTTSDEEIGTPNKTLSDYVIAFNIPSMKKFQSRVMPGGVMIVNSSMIGKDLYTRDDITYVEIPASSIAQDLGNMKVLNVVMLGFFTQYSGMVDIENAKKEVLKRMAKKPEYIELNAKAFDIGAAEARKYKA